MQSKATLFGTVDRQKKLALGACLVLALASFSNLCAGAAEAKLLNGGVETIDIQTEPSDTTRGGANPSEVNRQDMPKALTTGGAQPVPGTSTLVPGQPSLAYARTPNRAAPAPVNSFPVDFGGQWQCVTTVVDSAVATVAVGTQVISDVNFVDLPDGRIVARWVQPGWTETQASSMSWSKREAQTDRTSYYFGDGMNGSWASRSRDHFLQVDTNRLECKSYVDQYMDGQYIGRYRTVSILTRVAGGSLVDTIAQTKSKEK